MTLIDQVERDNIIKDEGNVVVSASAGSGKTTIMIKKIKNTLEDITDHKTIAAITFTNKAAEEIGKKAKDEGVTKEFVSMTNDAFIEHEIIRPFITDTYDLFLENDFTIDYNYKFRSFDNGLQAISEHSKLGVYKDIKRNFKFELAYDILKKNIVAREYIQAKYKMIFLDEYQDTDLDMHTLFMFLKDQLNITLFIVGDAKQAIYLWRGAQSNIFEMLKQDDMNHYSLIKNFRCHDEIVNYANLIHNSRYFNNDYTVPVSRLVHCKTDDFISSFTRMVENNIINIQEEITIIINVNNDARRCADKLNNAGYNFLFIPKTPIDDNTPNSYLLRQLACYIIDSNYSIYNFIENINVDSRKQTVNRIEEIIWKLKGEVNSEEFETTLLEFGDLLEIEFTANELSLLFKTVQDKGYHSAFIKSDDMHKVMTVFSSKGLEFKQVISFSKYYNDFENTSQNHYVSITRAEEKFIMVLSGSKYEDYINQQSKNHGVLDSKYLFKRVNHI